MHPVSLQSPTSPVDPFELLVAIVAIMRNDFDAEVIEYGIDAGGAVVVDLRLRAGSVDRRGDLAEPGPS